MAEQCECPTYAAHIGPLGAYVILYRVGNRPTFKVFAVCKDHMHLYDNTKTYAVFQVKDEEEQDG